MENPHFFFLVGGEITISLDMFTSYFKLPEGDMRLTLPWLLEFSLKSVLFFSLILFLKCRHVIQKSHPFRWGLRPTLDQRQFAWIVAEICFLEAAMASDWDILWRSCFMKTSDLRFGPVLGPRGLRKMLEREHFNISFASWMVPRNSHMAII